MKDTMQELRKKQRKLKDNYLEGACNALCKVREDGNSYFLHKVVCNVAKNSK